MRAIVIEGNSLRLREVPDPSLGPADLLVRIRATSVNRADLRRAAVHFKQSETAAAAIAGLEMAGEVIGKGADVSSFAIGDRVMAMTGGGYAEMVAIDHRLALPVPAKFTWARAAATPTVYVTAHDALVSQGGVTAGTQLLVQGASTGTGIAAVQIAHAWKADRVFGTAGTDDKVARLRALGCDTPINYRTSDVAKLVLEATQERGVDLVLDLVGRSAVAANIAAVAIKGRIICVGRVGSTTDEINLDEFARKRVTMTGTTFRTRTLDERTAVIWTLPQRDDPAVRRRNADARARSAGVRFRRSGGGAGPCANPEASLMTFGSQGANLAFSLQQIKGAGGGRYYLRGRLVRLFSRRKCLEGISVDMVDTINATIKRLHLMKVDSVKFEGKSWTSNWIRIYLQAHVRRALSLVESGLAEQRVGRTLTTALCSR